MPRGNLTADDGGSKQQLAQLAQLATTIANTISIPRGTQTPTSYISCISCIPRGTRARETAETWRWTVEARGADE